MSPLLARRFDPQNGIQAGLGCRIIMACRNSEKAEKAAEVIRATHPEAQVEVYKLDLQSLESARQFERDWQARNPTRQGQAVDLLICNAGAVFLESKRTPDGFEQTYQVGIMLAARHCASRRRTATAMLTLRGTPQLPHPTDQLPDTLLAHSPDAALPPLGNGPACRLPYKRGGLLGKR